MHIKSILAGAAIAIAASVGSASAADQFATLDGVTVQPMNAAGMDRVRGTFITLNVAQFGGLLQAQEDIINGILSTHSVPTRTVPSP